MNDTKLISGGVATPDALPVLAPLTQMASWQPVVPGGELLDYRGARSLSRFGDLATELRGLTGSAGIFDMGARVRLRVTGEDRVRWLNGMVTNNIKALAPGTHNYNFVLNAQGRIQGDATVFAYADSLVLETDRAQAERLHAHLDRFIIMDDVELGWMEGETTLGLAGPGAGAVLAAAGLPLPAACGFVAEAGITIVAEYSVAVPRYSLWVAEAQAPGLWQRLAAAGAIAAGVQAAEMLRIGEGLPLYGADMTEKTLPQETGQTQALNFNKGCYLGQEIVERIRSQAKVHRGLGVYWLSGDARPGMAVTVDGKVAGEVTSVAESLGGEAGPRAALVTVRLELAKGRVELAYEGGRARAVRPPFFGLAEPSA